MRIFCDKPIFFRHGKFLFWFEACLFCFAENCVPKVNRIFQYSLYRCVIPVINSSRSTSFTEVITIQHTVFQRCYVAVFGERRCYGSGRFSVMCHGKYLLHYRSSFRVRLKRRAIFILHIAERRAGTVFSFCPFLIYDLLDFPWGVSQINIVHRKLERSHNVNFVWVEVVADCNIMNLIFGKIGFRIVARLGHISAESWQVLGDNHVCKPVFKVSNHLAKARSVKIWAWETVVNKFFYNGNTVVLTVLPDDTSLVCDTRWFTAVGLLNG